MDNRRQDPETTLGLVGDGDELDFICSIEESFGIEFHDPELKDVYTVGELYDVVLRRLPNFDQRLRGRCRSATAFRRLRRALRLMALGEVRPSSQLSELIGGRRGPDFIRRLELASGLSLEAIHTSNYVFAACLSISAAASIYWIVVPADFPGLGFLAALALAAFATLGLTLVLLIPVLLLAGDRASAIDPQLTTVGDLAVQASHLNFAHLTAAGGRHHPTDVWRTLEWLARRTTDHKGEINRETRIIME